MIIINIKLPKFIAFLTISLLVSLLLGGQTTQAFSVNEFRLKETQTELKYNHFENGGKLEISGNFFKTGDDTAQYLGREGAVLIEKPDGLKVNSKLKSLLKEESVVHNRTKNFKFWLEKDPESSTIVKPGKYTVKINISDKSDTLTENETQKLSGEFDFIVLNEDGSKPNIDDSESADVEEKDRGDSTQDESEDTTKEDSKDESSNENNDSGRGESSEDKTETKDENSTNESNSGNESEVASSGKGESNEFEQENAKSDNENTTDNGEDGVGAEDKDDGSQDGSSKSDEGSSDASKSTEDNGDKSKLESESEEGGSEQEGDKNSEKDIDSPEPKESVKVEFIDKIDENPVKNLSTDFLIPVEISQVKMLSSNEKEIKPSVKVRKSKNQRHFKNYNNNSSDIDTRVSYRPESTGDNNGDYKITRLDSNQDRSNEDDNQNDEEIYNLKTKKDKKQALEATKNGWSIFGINWTWWVGSMSIIFVGFAIRKMHKK